MTDPTEDPRFMAGVDMLRRTGLAELQVRYSDDEEPVVWFVVGGWRMRNGMPVADGPITNWETAASIVPLQAVLRLCAQVLDGGVCRHCSRPTMFLDQLDDSPGPFDALVCVQSFDPELVTFRRDCEGDDR